MLYNWLRLAVPTGGCGELIPVLTLSQSCAASLQQRENSPEWDTGDTVALVP